MRRSLVISGLFVVSFVGAFACGGSTGSGGTGGQTVPVKPGDPCAALGATAPAADGCNTCSCTENGWACTEIACEQPCEENATQPAGDGCNTCSCTDGQWACTLMACPPIEECPAPYNPTPDLGCTQVVVYARSPNSDLCCMYGNPCVAPAGWQQFYSEEECAGKTQCVSGETRIAEDGCNTCACVNGDWACTDRMCTEPVACGGWLGDTCSETEYCAYVEGQMCGAADASATCQPRPEGCTMIYDPVCGCDGQTYGNDCSAAMAGTGVMSTGECK